MRSIRSLTLRLAEKVSGIEPGRFVSKIAGTGRPALERRTVDLSKYEDVYRTDPLVGSIIDWKATRVVGKGFRVRCLDSNGDEVEHHELHQIVRNSKPYSVIDEFIRNRYWGGTGYIEIDDEYASFRAVSPKKMRVEVDDSGEITKYEQSIGSGKQKPTWTTDDELKRIVRCPNRPLSDRKEGISDIEAVYEVAEILRDMQIDLSNFIESKAYATIIYMLGTKERPWAKTDVDAWLSAIEELKPGDVMAVSGDVDFKIPDVTGLDISPYLNFFASLVVSGLKVPSSMTSIIEGSDSATAEVRETNFKYFVASERQKIAETLEVDLFGEIIRQRGYTDIARVEVEWLKHDGEEERLAVNSVVQLLQNRQVSHETADRLLGLPVNARDGTLLESSKSVDAPEGSDPTINPEVDQNKSSDTNREEDNRHGSPRRTTGE